MPSLKLKRGTRAQVNAAATANQLKEGEPYLLTDENRLAVGLSDAAYEATAKFSEIGSSLLFGTTLIDGTTLTIATHGNKRLPVNGGTINLPTDADWPVDVTFEFESIGTTPTVINWAGNAIVSQDTGSLASQVIGGAIATTALVRKRGPNVAYLYSGSARGIDAIAVTLGPNPNTPAVGATVNYNFVSAAGLALEGLYRFSGIVGPFKVTAIAGNTVTIENVSGTENAPVPAGTKLTPTGIKGDTGAPGTPGAKGDTGAAGISTIATVTGSPPVTPGIGLTAVYAFDSVAGIGLQRFYGFDNLAGAFLVTAISELNVTLQNVTAAVGATITAGTKIFPTGRPALDYTPLPIRSGSDVTIAIAAGISTAAQTANSLRAWHWEVKKTISLVALRQEVATLAATSNFRLAIYADNGSLYPGALIANSDTGAYDSSTIGVKLGTFAAPITLAPGSYWLAFNCTSNPTLRTIPVSSLSASLGGIAAGGTNGTATCYVSSQTFGAMPATFPAGATLTGNVQAPYTMFRTA